jgi:hypothetical protein
VCDVVKSRDDSEWWKIEVNVLTTDDERRRSSERRLVSNVEEKG